MIRAIVGLLDTIIFLWIAIKGLLFIWEGGGGYILFWGCALVCTAVYWKTLDKESCVTSIENVFRIFKR